MKQVKLLYPFKNSSYQTFMQDMADSLIDAGMKYVEPMAISWNIRHIAAKTKICCNIKRFSKNKAFIVLAGGYPDASAFPLSYVNEIIPVLWDTWPKYWDDIVSSFKRNNIRIAFFTQKQVAEYVMRILPNIICYHIPEGIASYKYNKKAPDLINREIDLLELGRVFSKFHNSLKLDQFKHLFQNSTELLFPTFDDLTAALRNSKLTVCFPRSMIHPTQAGSVETLTQRYWECMLSKTLIVGHAPQELVELIGYNPTIEIDLNKDVNQQIISLIRNINMFQSLVDKNYYTAINIADWKYRIPFIIEKLKQNGYKI